MDIFLQQLVYGSFPFWDRGYDVLARSPGFRAEWVAEVLSACQQIGEAPSGVTPSPALFSLLLASGPRAIVGVEPLGHDDRGRPGALAFHALLVDPGDYRKAGSDPFAFAAALRGGWSAGTSLDALPWTVGPRTEASPPADPRAWRIVEALSKGRRVAIESTGPIDALARVVWPALPESTRRRASVATWAFGNANRFDLVAFPRLAGVALDRSYVDPSTIDADPPEPAVPPKTLPLYRAPVVAGFAIAGAIAAGLAWRGWQGTGDPGIPPEASLANLTVVETPVGPATRARVVDGLEALADRFERFEIDHPGDPAALMARISEQVRYRGPTLSPAELARLRAESDPDRDRALAWHDRIRTFADDRPLPDDFARLPIGRQLDRLAWSFHLDPPPRPVDVPGALLEALSRDGPIRPTPLAARYPALSDYARFLGRLPRLSAEIGPVGRSQSASGR